jgi:hypothetical protein
MILHRALHIVGGQHGELILPAGGAPKQACLLQLAVGHPQRPRLSQPHPQPHRLSLGAASGGQAAGAGGRAAAAGAHSADSARSMVPTQWQGQLVLDLGHLQRQDSTGGTQDLPTTLLQHTAALPAAAQGPQRQPALTQRTCQPSS